MSEEKEEVKLEAKHFVIDEQLLVGVINYLRQRPYAEVQEAMPKLLNLKQVKLDERPS